MMAQVLGTLPPTWDTWLVSKGSWLQPGVALAVEHLESELVSGKLCLFSLFLHFK